MLVMVSEALLLDSNCAPKVNVTGNPSVKNLAVENIKMAQIEDEDDLLAQYGDDYCSLFDDEMTQTDA